MGTKCSVFGLILFLYWLVQNFMYKNGTSILILILKIVEMALFCCHYPLIIYPVDEDLEDIEAVATTEL